MEILVGLALALIALGYYFYRAPRPFDARGRDARRRNDANDSFGSHGDPTHEYGGRAADPPDAAASRGDHHHHHTHHAPFEHAHHDPGFQDATYCGSYDDNASYSSSDSGGYDSGGYDSGGSDGGSSSSND